MAIKSMPEEKQKVIPEYVKFRTSDDTDGSFNVPGKLLAKLLEIYKAVDNIEKKGHNDFSDYDYVRAVDMARLMRKEFAERSLVLIPSILQVLPFTNEGGKQKNGVRVVRRNTVIDQTTGEWFRFNSVGEGVDVGDKAIYKAVTGAMKYALRDLFMLPDEKGDPEADEEGSKPDAKPEKKGPRRVKEDDERTVSEEGSDFISRAQRGRLFAIARSAHPEAQDDEALEKIVADVLKKFDITSTKDIPTRLYDKIVDLVGGKKLKVKGKHDDDREEE